MLRAHLDVLMEAPGAANGQLHQLGIDGQLRREDVRAKRLIRECVEAIVVVPATQSGSVLPAQLLSCWQASCAHQMLW